MEVILLHGYSGCPENFGKLPAALRKEGYKVSVPKLPFHTTEKELMQANFVDFLSWFETYMQKKKECIVIGYSLGAQLALAVRKNQIKKIIAVTPPFPLKFPFTCWWLATLPFLKTSVFRTKKEKYEGELSPPLKGLLVIHQGNNYIKKHNQQPDLRIYLKNDFVINHRKIQQTANTIIIANKDQEHNPFINSVYREVNKEIMQFLNK